MTNPVCIVEDDDKVAALLESQLTRFGFPVERIRDLRHVADHVRAADPSLILLDINLPYFDGFHWCRQIRRFSRVPIVFVSARSGDMDQVMALEHGGDDYITKPFHPDVLLAKVRALLRRAYGEYAVGPEPGRAAGDGRLRLGCLSLDLRRATVSAGDASQPLSKTELELLRLLVQADGAVVKREDLLEALWDDATFVDDNTLTVNVARVRRKLSTLGLEDAIVTVRGLGYRLDAAALGASDAGDGGRLVPARERGTT